ncbi:MAG: hypothetical protein WC178_01580 [Candidatus Paceibacterota bacterium]
MPSINLLPENFTIEAYKKREKIAIYVLAVFFLLSSVAMYGLVENDCRNLETKSNELDVEIVGVKEKINTEIEKSELLSSNYNKKDIEKVLGEHLYLSEALSFPEELIIQDAYLESLDFDGATSAIGMQIITKDYDAFITQVALLKGSFWIDSLEIGSISSDKESGGVSVSVNATLREDMFVFHEQYWGFGLSLLAENVNRYVKIETYSIIEKSVEKDNEVGVNENKKEIIVNFEGEAYDKSHLDQFEENLNDMDEISKVTLNRSVASSAKPGVIGFNGSMELSY